VFASYRLPLNREVWTGRETARSYGGRNVKLRKHNKEIKKTYQSSSKQKRGLYRLP